MRQREAGLGGRCRDNGRVKSTLKQEQVRQGQARSGLLEEAQLGDGEQGQRMNLESLHSFLPCHISEP